MKPFARLHKALPRGVWVLGLVSLLMDVSSEMVHGLLPVFLVSVLGASATAIGLIEGVGEGIALVTRMFSGVISDWLGRRKALIVAGYLLGTLTKPLFALAQGVGLVFGARSLDRFGKGLRGAPRDALIADLTPADRLGAAFGLRQALDSLGAVLGPLLAVILMTLTADNFRLIFWLAVFPGLAAVTLLITLVRDPETTRRPGRVRLRLRELRQLGRGYWLALGLGVIFTLARFSEAFLLLRAEDLGLSANLIPLVLLLLSLFYALGAYPAGSLSDRLGRELLLGLGLLFLLGADLVLAAATNIPLVMLGAGLWGLHLAFTQGLFAALVADTSTPQLRGTAFGLYGFATGLAILLASLLAGELWDSYGAPIPFYVGAGLASLALLGLWFRTGLPIRPKGLDK